MEITFFKKSIKEIENEISTDALTGLTDTEAKHRQEKYGKNTLVESKKKNLFQLFLEQIGDFMVLTLLGAAVISLILGEISEAVLIVVIVILNSVLGIIQEHKAEKSLEAIKKLSSPHAKVIRNNKLSVVPMTDLVIGDVIVFEAGDYIPADIRIIELNGLKIDESSLTGESVPVEKSLPVIKKDDLPLGEMINCAFMSTAVTYGSGKGIVTATGMDTQIGRIAKMLTEVDYMQTPIQKHLDHLGKMLLGIILAACTIIFFIGIRHNLDIFQMFLTAVSLAVAAIPEGLPALVTIVLALGIQKMVKFKAIVRKLPAVETLGLTDIICTDKTGTLTQNKMTVMELYINGKHYDLETSAVDKELSQLLVYVTLCNNTKLTKNMHHLIKIGDPTETALIDLAVKFKMDPLKYINDYHRLYEIPFDSNRKLMSTVNHINGVQVVITKGAPESVFSICKAVNLRNTVSPFTAQQLKTLEAANNEMTNRALRVIAVAYRVMGPDEKIQTHALEKNLTFLGLVGMIDPPRPDVKESILKCHTAGIDTVMITGDHKNTAMAIAKDLDMIHAGEEAISGLELDALSDEEFKKKIQNIKVYARVSPEHKVRIVKAWNSLGKVVAMTGDGVNDAPALKNADIGIAMGLSGTEVAKEASDMILMDDNFSTIVHAVEEGRTIFTNIRKSIHFLLSCNTGEIITIFLGTLLGQVLYGFAISPLTAVQLLWGNLVTDSLIALAIGLEKPEADIMKKQTKQRSLLTWQSGTVLLFQGLLIGFLSFLAFHWGFRMEEDMDKAVLTARTMAFMTLTFAQLFHAFNIRSENHSIFEIGVFSNKYIVFAFLICGFLQLSTIITPFTRELFGTILLSVRQFYIVFCLSIAPVLVVEFSKIFYRDK